MPTRVNWLDDTEAGHALARAMAQTYGLSQEAVFQWYQKAVAALDNLDRARDAVKGLVAESFVVATYEYSQKDQGAYHAHYWEKLTKAVGLTEQFCPVCGQWYPPGAHTCPSSQEEV